MLGPNVGTDVATALAVDASAGDVLPFFVPGLVAWFDPGFGYDDDGSNAAWKDRKSGYVVAGTGSTRPAKPAKVAALNERLAVTFTAASSQRLSGSVQALVDVMNGASAYTLYTAGVVTIAGAGTRCAVGVGSTSSARFIEHAYNISSDRATYNRRDSANVTANIGSVAALNVAHVAAWTWTGSAVFMHQNGTTAINGAENTRANVTPSDVFSVGAAVSSNAWGDFFGGSIGDVLVFSGAHSAGERQLMERWLMRRYGFAF